ncbi:lipoprotein [Fictibacillus phosphorivorans]
MKKWLLVLLLMMSLAGCNENEKLMNTSKGS